MTLYYRMRQHMLSWEIHLHTPLPHTLPPRIPPPESLQTGDILCCIWFEIISYNRWVLFPEPASQPALHRGLWWQRGYDTAHARRAVQFSSQCHHTHRSIGTGFFPEIPVGVWFTSCALGWGVNAGVFLKVWWSGKLKKKSCFVELRRQVGRQQSDCTMQKWAGDQHTAEAGSNVWKQVCVLSAAYFLCPLGFA